MKHNILLLFIFLIAISHLVGCQDRKKKDVDKLLHEWVGQTVDISDLVYTIQGYDTVDFHPDAYDYKILSYVDSSGCTGCKMSLEEWQDYIFETDSLYNGKVGFIMYYSPKSANDAIYYLDLVGFEHPVCI